MDLLRGTLDVLILKTVSWGPVHGYAISRSIRDQTGSVFNVEEGALYPALRRLEKKALVRSDWGVTDTGREAKFYTLTESGAQRLAAEMASWTRYVEAMSRVLHAKRPAG
jgi:transcriptional regulator